MNKLKHFFYYYKVASVSAIILLLISLIFYFETKKRADIRSESLFQLITNKATSTIENRIIDYIQILRSTEAFISSTDTVTRVNWKQFVGKLNLEKNYPGIQGLAYSLIIPADKLASHISQIRSEGFSDYDIKPSGERELYTSIIYIEPFTGRNLRAFGFDMYSEPIRRKAMELARDTGEPAISGKVKLVQETEEDIQPGFLLYLPVYQQNSEPETIAERQKLIKGYIYNPFRANDLINSVLGNHFNSIDIEIFDETLSKDALLYNSDTILDYGRPEEPGRHSQVKTLTIAGHEWKIFFSSGPEFGPIAENTQANVFLIAGTLVSIMTFFALSAILKVKKSRKEKDKAIQKNADLMQKVFLEVPALVALLNASDLTYLLANKLYFNLFGGKDLLHKPIREVHTELQGQGFLNRIRTVIQSHKPYIGKEIPVSINSTESGKNHLGYFNFIFQPLFNDQSKVEMILIFAVDVSEQVAAREELNSSNRELNKKNTELIKINNDLDNFIYTASHDLKAPISNIEGLTLALGEILSSQHINHESKELLKMIDQSINRFKSTIQDLSDITKIQKNTAEDIEDVLVAGIIEEVIEEIRNLVNASEADISVKCHPPLIRFSKVNFKSIVHNLLTNAIKYRSPERNPKIEIHCQEDSNYYLLEVKDNGLGINETQKEKIFGMFKRAHTHVEGTGVGLYIVKRIVENYHGKIVVESTEGKGASFRIYFPKQL